jgi:hypothetical protein
LNFDSHADAVVKISEGLDRAKEDGVISEYKFLNYYDMNNVRIYRFKLYYDDEDDDGPSIAEYAYNNKGMFVRKKSNLYPIDRRSFEF